MIFETKAILQSESPKEWDLPYLNLVVTGTSSLTPFALLETLKEIEREMGRDFQAQRWAPRVIDLDILAWNDLILWEEKLQIPHPELMNRPFLVRQMASLNAEWRYPVSGFAYSHLTLAEILHTYLYFDRHEVKCFMPFPQMVGIVNVTPDSFTDGGNYFQAEKALQRIHELADQGAAVIDIGAQSTHPGAAILSAEEEWGRLQPVLELLQQSFQDFQARPQISLDSYYPEVIQKALRSYPINWINDVSGGKDPRLLEVVAETSCKLILTHSLTVPATKEVILPFDKCPLIYLCEWAEKKLGELKSYGIERDQIILDPGIGFGKTHLQSFSILRGIDHLKKFGCEILVGHSRKLGSKASDRDLETLGVSHCLLKKGIGYLRVHHVEAHQRSLTARALVEGIDAV